MTAVPKTCNRCNGGAFRRINRKGWMQRVLLSMLGFYPWECVHCRLRRFYRDTGQSSARQRSATFH